MFHCIFDTFHKLSFRCCVKHDECYKNIKDNKEHSYNRLLWGSVYNWSCKRHKVTCGKSLALFFPILLKFAWYKGKVCDPLVQVPFQPLNLQNPSKGGVEVTESRSKTIKTKFSKRSTHSLVQIIISIHTAYHNLYFIHLFVSFRQKWFRVAIRNMSLWCRSCQLHVRSLLRLQRSVRQSERKRTLYKERVRITVPIQVVDSNAPFSPVLLAFVKPHPNWTIPHLKQVRIPQRQRP